RTRRRDAPPLVLVGNRGWLFAEAMRLINSLKLTEHVRYFENLPDAELPAIYNGAHCLSLTSHYEGFGFPVLEAMGCGVPVVISDRASLPEIAGGAALAVSPDDSSELAHALERLLFDEALRQDLRARGLERARSFSWERCGAETVALYRAVASDAARLSNPTSRAQA
ncbi:MAG TPA: glycosyltransferase family 1 protein, partial [Anaerolineales bacterium]|nr:glycosyltransferase family 1 protein [Anaerolineales bacterium]